MHYNADGQDVPKARDARSTNSPARSVGEENRMTIVQGERVSDRLLAEADALEETAQLRSAYRRMQDFASRIPPLSAEQVHAVVASGRLSQFQFRRQADRYLLAVCLSFLAVAASILWRTAADGLTPFNVAVLVIAIAVAWVALRAAHSLWLMRQTLRLRHRPYRMSRYADRLNRLSRRRHLWLDFVLKDSYNNAPNYSHSRPMQFPVRIPSYTVAACLLLFVLGVSSNALAAPRACLGMTSTSSHSVQAICDTVGAIIERS